MHRLPAAPRPPWRVALAVTAWLSAPLPAWSQDDAPAEEADAPAEEADAPADEADAPAEEADAPAAEDTEADAGEASDAELPAEPLPRAARIPAPKVRAIAFVDPYRADATRSGEADDCDTFDARKGLCTERVRFAGIPDAFAGQTPDGHTGEAWRAITKNTASLYLWNWDGIAMRWFRDDDPIATTIRTSPVQALPQPSETWLQARPEDRRLISLPHRNGWLDAEQWVEDRDTAYTPPFYPLAEYHPQVDPRVTAAAAKAEGVPPEEATALDNRGFPLLPETARMTGRFAERLGFNSQPHPYEIMDADEDSSGPFFEQMFPYNTARRTDRPTGVRPLARFQDPEQLLRATSVDELDRQPWEVPILLSDEGIREFEVRAAASFEEFSRLLGVSVARYSLRDHTLNQMRILTALTAMRSPPDADVLTKGRYRGLVAAARGETDSDSQLGFDFQRQLGGVSGGIELRLRTLPTPVRDSWLNRMVAEVVLSEEANRPRLRMAPAEVLRDAEARLRNDEVIAPLGLLGNTRLKSLTTTDIRAFLEASVEQKSRLRPFVYEDANAIVLGAVLNSLNIEDRDTYETWILLDHLDHSIAEQLRAQGGAPQPPAAVASTGQGQFVKVLESHGRTSSMVPQGLQAVDPLAICTREPGRAALGEPTFKPVLLDLVVQGPDPDGEVNPATVVWAVRDQVPFVAVDDPEAAVPTVARLSDLPGPDSLYRIRWRLWSGWHLLWSPQTLPDGSVRLAVRTAAVCEDMSLTPRDLVPTVVRGGLLSGELFPTEPFRWTDLERTERRIAKRNLRLDGTVDGTTDVATKKSVNLGQTLASGADAAATVGSVKTEGVGAVKDSNLQQKAQDLNRRYSPSSLEARRLQELTPGQTATYLRSLVHPHLRRLSKKLGGLLLMVFDHQIADDRRKTGDAIRPRTPYRRVHRGVPGEVKEVRSAAWTIWVPPGADAPIAMVGPAWRETDLVNNPEQPVPRWRPRRPGDFTLFAALGEFPYRQVWTTCVDDPQFFDTIAPCAVQADPRDPEGRPSYLSEGFSIDMGGLFTWWLLHRPRIAFESGLEGRLDVVPRGPALFYEGQPDYAWAFNWAGGPILGVRFAPKPSSLWMRGKQGNTWGPQRPEGGNRVGRTQWGLRGGVLFGSGFSGVESTFAMEAWYGRSVRRIRSVHQSFTPYHPAFLVGPFVRAHYTIPMPFTEPTPGLQVLDEAWTVIIGARVNLRIKAQGPTLPAAP